MRIRALLVLTVLAAAACAPITNPDGSTVDSTVMKAHGVVTCGEGKVAGVASVKDVSPIRKDIKGKKLSDRSGRFQVTIQTGNFYDAAHAQYVVQAECLGSYTNYPNPVVATGLSPEIDCSIKCRQTNAPGPPEALRVTTTFRCGINSRPSKVDVYSSGHGNKIIRSNYVEGIGRMVFDIKTINKKMLTGYYFKFTGCGYKTPTYAGDTYYTTALKLKCTKQTGFPCKRDT